MCFMTGLNIKFPAEIRPHINAYKQLCIGLAAWQVPQFANPEKIEMALTHFESINKGDSGIALSKDLTDLPTGPTPNVSYSIRSALVPLIKGENDYVVLMTSLTQFLIGHCYALIEESKRLDPHRTDPLIQFFRHVRNGCFHGNKFNIHPPKPGKQWREAKWRGKEITLSMNEENLFRPNLAEKDFFLNWGDAILLLSDVCALVYQAGNRYDRSN